MNPAVFNFGRFNPITMGHIRLIDTTERYAVSMRSDYFLFPSRTHDTKCNNNNRNPLPVSTKIAFIREVVPLVNIVDEPNVISPHQVIEYLANMGYCDITFAVGSDRLEEFTSRWLPYALAMVKTAQVISPVVPRGGSDSVSNICATKARQAAYEGQLSEFKQTTGWHGGLHDNYGEELYNAIRESLGLTDGRTK